MNKLECHKLCKSFEIGDDNINVLNNIDLVIEAGDSIAITGKSGAGKSTLLHILATLDRPTSGSVLLDGDNLTNSSNENLSKVRLNNFGFVYQFHHLLDDFNAFDNCKIVQDLNNKKNNPNIDELLISVGLKDKFKSYPYQLSGGEKQRLAIARALSNNPNFLIMDEPTGNLDNKTSKLIQDLILEISHKRNIGIILATHDLNFANMMDTVYEIFDGGLRKINE